MPQLKVLGARVLIEKEAVEETTSTGIILTSSAQEPVYQGTVVAVGNGMLLESGQRVPMGVSVGDKVIYAQFAGVPVQSEGKDLLVINEADIVAIIE